MKHMITMLTRWDIKQNGKQQKVLFENTARAMGDAPREIKIRHIGNCTKADPAYGAGVAGALGISMSEVPEDE